MKASTKSDRPFEHLYKKYDAWYDNEPGRSLFAIEALALRESLLSPPGKALEIGVGSGRFASALGVRFGLDPAVNPLRLARQRGMIGVAGDGEWLPFRSGVFDTCLLVVTLCFVENPVRVLDETFRILRPSGQVILGMVLRDSPWGTVYQTQAEAGHPFYSLSRFYTHEEILYWLKRAGFISIEIFSTLFQPHGKLFYDRETPRHGFDRGAGFTVFRGVKRGM